VLILFKKENDKLFLAMQGIQTGDQTNFTPVFAEVTESELKEKMKTLDRKLD
jgi:hypothetical protein